MSKRTITQTARKTFINTLSSLKLLGDELVVLEFDEGNVSMFADRIYLQSSGVLLYGQLELPIFENDK